MATKQTEASRKYQNKVGLISLNDTPFLEGRSTKNLLHADFIRYKPHAFIEFYCGRVQAPYI